MCERTCAVCGKVIKERDLCSSCWKKYTNRGKSYPKWLRALVTMQSGFERSHASTKETPFSRYYKTGEPQ